MATKLRVAGMTLAALVLAAMPVMADPVNVGDTVYITNPGDNSRFYYEPTSSGGPFNLYNQTTGSGPFVTFCLERGEPMAFGERFKVDGISDSATNGGKSGQDPAGGNKDPLDVKTKWIYWMFATQGAAWTGKDVQEAIWYIEGEIPEPWTADYTQYLWQSAAAKKIYEDATNLAGISNFGASYSVRALNLHCMDKFGVCEARAGLDAQDVIIGDPVPEPASLVLLGSGLLGLAAWRRRRQ